LYIPTGSTEVSYNIPSTALVWMVAVLKDRSNVGWQNQEETWVGLALPLVEKAGKKHFAYQIGLYVF
jgi:hypothetical protein